MQQAHERNPQTSALQEFNRDERGRYASRLTLWVVDVLAIKSIASRLAKLKEAQKSSLLIGASIILVATLFGLVATVLIVSASTQRNAAFTASFIQALGAVDASSTGLAGHKTSDVLDSREDNGLPEGIQVDRQKSRRMFFESLKNIASQPDTLLINVYASDNVIVWSSNPKLIGQRFPDDEKLEGAASTRDGVVTSYHEVKESREEQQFIRKPSSIFVENYIPLINSAGKVPSVVEFYTEPPSWLANTRSGYLVTWLACSMGGALIYLGLISFTGKRGGVFSSRIQQSIDNEMAVLLNEVSTVVAHNLRNPLAVVRSSAELALEVGSEAACKNIGDIINQVDRMSKWIKDLHVASTSLKGEIGEVDPVEAVLETLRNFERPLSSANVHVEFSASRTPQVTGHHQLLVQILDSLVSNAIDAMPEGGVLYIAIHQNSFKRLSILLRDTGKGMTASQQKALFRPRCSIKHGGFGIGLMLVKLIMKRFGGHASLTSSKNKGTAVNLCFRMGRSG
ncbi:MAG: HAMP domain-containing sensor histidine kinase [Pseudomonas sp.]